MAGEALRAFLAESRRTKALSIIRELDVLPTTMAVPLQVLQLQNQPNAGIQEYAEVISADQGLCTKLLGLANSAFFAASRPITRLPEAIARIGLKNLLPLVFGASLSGVFNKLGLPPSERNCLWRSSVLKAVAAREYARERAKSVEAEAFIVGLAQDLALPVLYGADCSAWPSLMAALDLEHAERVLQEEQLYAIDHCRLGGIVAKKLNLPAVYQEMIEIHHDEERLLACTSRELAECAAFAAAVPHYIDAVSPSTVQMLRRSLCRQGESAAAAASAVQLLDRVRLRYRELLAAFGEGDVGVGAAKGFLQEVSAQVARCIQSAIVESQKQIGQLKDREVQLQARIRELEGKARRSDYDSLTNVLNRTGFMHRLDQLFGISREYRQGCAIGFVDLDDFKRINDTHGHAAGDRALCAVATALRETVRGCGGVGRLGGDEFAFAVVANNASGAAGVADQVREAIGAIALGATGGPSKVSASIGVFWMGIPAEGQGTAEAVEQADRLMYQAKREGKARCVVGQISAGGSGTVPQAA